MTQTTIMPAGELAVANRSCEAWAMSEDIFHAQMQLLNRVTVHLPATQDESESASEILCRFAADIGGAADNAGTLLSISDGIAVIGVSGMMAKQSAGVWASTSTVLVRRKLRMAANHPKVAGILLVWETSGGTVAGTHELAEEIAAVGQQKPVWSFAEDMCCCAGYWAACRAAKIFANSMAIVGSIGTFIAVRDSSKGAENAGVKVHLVKAGKFKGAGTPGTVISGDFLAELQANVNELNEHFVASVAAGRKLSIERARALADGRRYLAAAAVQAGLIDGVQSLEKTFSQFVAQVKSPRPAAAGTALEPPAAAAHQSTRVAVVEPAAATDHSVSPAPSCMEGTKVMSHEDPIAAWNAAVRQEMEAAARIGHPISKAQATAKVARENEPLRAAYVEASNSQSRERHAMRGR